MFDLKIYLSTSSRGCRKKREKKECFVCLIFKIHYFIVQPTVKRDLPNPSEQNACVCRLIFNITEYLEETENSNDSDIRLLQTGYGNCNLQSRHKHHHSTDFVPLVFGVNQLTILSCASQPFLLFKFTVV